MRTEGRPHRGLITDAFCQDVLLRLREGLPVRRTLPDGGRLHIDRLLPFLCVYRQPVASVDAGTRKLVEGEAAFLIASAEPSAHLSRLIRGLAELMAERFGASLIVELWAGPARDVAMAAETNDLLPTELRPDFVLAARGPNTPQRTLEALRRGLQRVSIVNQRASVRIDPTADAHPPGVKELLSRREATALTCHTIGLRIRPIYRDHETDAAFPAVIRGLKRGVGRALKQAFFTFAKTRTRAKPEHYYSLGRRSMVKAVRQVDRGLAAIGNSFDFLLSVTPVNGEAAWHEFRKNHCERAPRFYYRPLAADPVLLKRRLFTLPIERIEDPTLADLLRQRQDELDRKITMLADIGTPRFVAGSAQVFGRVSEDLLAVAEDLLSRLPAHSRDDAAGGTLDAEQFAVRARAEIGFYRSQHPAFVAEATVRADMFAGLLCSQGNLLIGAETKVPERRVDALLQHEIGTHLLTYYNGLAEPFELLRSGFAGYDAMQEGLAVVTEFLVGGLTTPRLRLLAARVVSSHGLLAGATFVDTFRTLERSYGFAQRSAYSIALRTHRGGGLTKDAIYLRGLMEVMDFLQNGGDLELLFVGKIAAEHVPIIRELQLRKVLRAPALKPRYLEMPGVAARLERLRGGIALADLVKKKRR